MTPKEKAIDLYDKFIDSYDLFGKRIANECALIAVDEILQEIRYNKKIDWLIERRNGEEYITYWLEVKQELEKL